MKDRLPVEIVERWLWRCLVQDNLVEGSDLRVGDDAQPLLEFIPSQVERDKLRCPCGGHVILMKREAT